MKRQQLIALFDREQRIEIEYPDMIKEVLPHVIRFRRPAPGMNFILYSQLNEDNVEGIIDEQVADMRQFNQPYEWKVYAHDQPADLKDRLVAKGFSLEEPEAVMLMELKKTPASLLKPPSVEVKTIEHRDQLGDVVAILEKVWGGSFEWVYGRLGDHLEIPGYVKVYVAYSAGQAACTGWIIFNPNSQIASLWGGSTIPELRGQGLYSAVLAMRVQEAHRRNYRYLTMDASPMSQPILEHHGFEVLTYATGCKWED